MFGFLKKKIDSFTEKVKGKIEKKEEEKVIEEQKPVDEPKKQVLERIEEQEQEKRKEEHLIAPEEKKIEEDLSEEEKEVLQEIKEEEKEKELEKKTKKPKQKEEAVKEFKKEAEEKIKQETKKKVFEERKEKQFEEQLEKKLEKETRTPEPKKILQEKPEFKDKSDLIKERELKAKVSLTTGLKKFFTGKIKIEEKDVKNFLEEFELALMEADVEQNTAGKIIEEIKKTLIGKEIDGKNLTESLKKEIALIIEKLIKIPEIDLEKKMHEKKPLVILFLGPNGAGKTTSIAKIAFRFKKKGKTVVLAAADTFRAASIEQIEKHSQKLGVKLVKHKYGSDPAAVAFDARKSAEAKGIDLVLIDSAGRQETNTNLMNELKKIDRVVQPDLKLFVGEAMAGNSLFEQAKEFKEKIGFDGFILTKIDTDAKGGTAISLISGLQKPVVFVGTGQSYEQLVEFTPKFITERIIK